jgi:hypothetical protein
LQRKAKKMEREEKKINKGKEKTCEKKKAHVQEDWDPLHEPRYYKSKSAENTAEFLTFFT